MTERILLIANTIAYFALILGSFPLVEGMLDGKSHSLWLRLLVGLVDAALIAFLAWFIQANLLYPIVGLVILLQILLLFQKPLKDSLFVTLVIMMNVMCISGLSVSIFALLFNQSLYGIRNTPRLFQGALLFSNLLRLIFISMTLWKVSMISLRFAMHHKTQSKYIMGWSGLCILFMLHNSGAYIQDIPFASVTVDHLGYYFILFLSYYFVLAYTIRLNNAAEIRKINRSLSCALSNNIQLQSALMRDALFVAQGNLTQDVVVSGLEIYREALERVNMKYSAWFEFIKPRIYPSDYDIFVKSLERQNLIDNYEKGIEPKPFEYRRLEPDGSYRWVKLVLRTFREMESGDVHIFVYAFDIEKEVRDRELLLKSAQTDLFTGLYNKATTELIIGEEIRKGAGILLLLDVDNFKNINDNYGHMIGDRVLKQISELLTRTFRKIDIVGRTGGDEFTIYIKDTADLTMAEERVTALLDSLRGGVICDNKRIIVTISVGIVVVDEKIDSFTVAYNRADSALYQVKGTGKNGYHIYTDSRSAAIPSKNII